MNRSRKSRQPLNRTTKKKIILLTFLLVILFAVSTAAYMNHQYEQARKDSLKMIEEQNGKIIEEEIEFNPEPEVEDFVHVLLIGVDNSDNGPARTDTIMIAQYKPNEGTAKLISLMRDSFVSIPGYRDNKINTAYFLGGAELLRKTIKENFDIDIHYFAQVNFNGFERMVDIISPNGIEIDIKSRMYYTSNGVNINFKPGLQRLDGKDTLKYVRFRSDHENDFGRVRRQQEVISILKNDLLSLSGVSKLPQLLGAIEPFVQTNIDNKQILNYGKSFFLNPVEKIETMTIPVEGTFVDARFDYAGIVLKLDIEANKKALHEFLELKQTDEQ